MDFDSRDAEEVRVIVIQIERRMRVAEERLKYFQENGPGLVGDRDLWVAKLQDLASIVSAWRTSRDLIMTAFPSCWKDLEEMGSQKG